MVGARIIEIDGGFDQTLAQDVVIEINVGLRIAGKSSNVVNSLNGLHDDYSS
jgi:hypothetical protein